MGGVRGPQTGLVGTNDRRATSIFVATRKSLQRGRCDQRAQLGFLFGDQAHQDMPLRFVRLAGKYFAKALNVETRNDSVQ